MATIDLRPRCAVFQTKPFYCSSKVSVRIITTSSSTRSKNSLRREKITFFGRAFRVLNPGPLQTSKACKIRALHNPFRGAPVPFEKYGDFLSNLVPSVNALEISAAALGFVAGLAVHLSRPRFAGPQGGGGGREELAGEWILFTSPTLFNRFVVLRCPSISFTDEYDVSRKLMKDNRHFIKLSAGTELSGYLCQGKILSTAERFSIEGEEEEFSYQRLCLSAEDGGVISLDWPANLDLAGEHGLGTTILLVPGTAEGSNDKFIRGFVCKALRNGYFPVVMNPRGCAGSPLTTPRLFTAADSDDVCIAVQFINRLRPWTTLMGVGWGYGANMLTKYLGEAAETTPLTAAVCIGNPFDLEEATRSSSHHSVLDKKLMEGLKDILRSNKVLFQGRRKGFDVASALSATSVRDFEMAISRVVHGFDTIEDFYTKASSREIIGRVKIPTLFIQNDHTVAPMFSVPRNSIEDNPFTSLLFCSSISAGSTIANGQNATIQWCDNLVIEWLAAVELAFLKGRHPLLKDVDITIKPTNDPLSQQEHVMDSAVSNSVSYKIGPSTEKFLDFSDRETFDVFSGSHLNDRDEDHKFQLNNKSMNLKLVQKKVNKHVTDTQLQKGKPIGLSQETGSSRDATDRVEESENGVAEAERGQVLQTAETVMRMLDVTMPGTLADEQKQQVLNAVGRGETLITALQSAVPEEVRGKLNASVSGAVQTHGLNLKLVGLSKAASTSSLLMDLNSTSQENIGELSKGKVDGSTIEDSSNSVSNKAKTSEDANRLDTTRQQEMVNTKSNGEGSGADQSNEKLQNADNKTKTEEKPSNSDFCAVESQTGGESEDAEGLENPKGGSNATEKGIGNSSPGKQMQEDMKQAPLENELDQDKASQDSDPADNHNEKQRGEKSGVSEACEDEQDKGKEGTIEADRKSAPEKHPKRESTLDQKSDEKTMNSELDQGKQNSGSRADDPSLQVGMGSNEQNKTKETSVECDGKSAGEQQTKGEETSDQKIDEKSVNSQEEQNKQSSDPKDNVLVTQGVSSPAQSPTISVQQALDALTGFDDSTQLAVTNVFGVIENMIDQFEKEKLRKAEDIKARGNKNQDQDYLQSQTDSLEPNDENTFEKREQIPTAANKSCDCSDNATEHFDIVHKTGLAENQEKLIHNIDQAQLQGIDETQTYDIKDNTSWMGDCVEVQGIKSQNANARKEGKDSEAISVSPNGIKQRDKFELQAKTNNFQGITFQEYLSVKYPPLTKPKIASENTESINELFLEYVPEEGQWKLLEQIESTADSLEGESVNDKTIVNRTKKHTQAGNNMPMHVIEPSYIVLNRHIDSDNSQNRGVQGNEEETEKKEDILSLVKTLVLDTLRQEVIRRLGVSCMETLRFDLEEELSNVANAVALAVKQDLQMSGKAMSRGIKNFEHLQNCKQIEMSKLGPLHGELIVSAISSVLKGPYVLGRLVPVGVVVGASLVALRRVFTVITGEEHLVDTEGNVCQSVPSWNSRTNQTRESRKEISYKFINSTEAEKQEVSIFDERHQNTQERTMKKKGENDGRAMVGAVTVVLGATAALKDHQMNRSDLFKANDVTPDSSVKDTSHGHENKCDARNSDETKHHRTSEGPEHDRNSDETEHEQVKPNIVSSLAEKAISVAAPVVPTKDDGEVDHERLVAVLADLGQKGGMLRLVGKLALLWGGLRGAMSLTDRLIIFLRIAERPLHQRLLGFSCMALLLWSPVVVPLLPALLEHWSLHTSLGVAGIASRIGLYGAVVILVTIWGKRIRGYEQPLEQYGLSISSVSEVFNLSKGMIIGFMFFISLYSTYSFLGYALFTVKPEYLFFSRGFISAIKIGCRISRLILNAFGMALAAATIEELLFRSWLHEEIASDLGFHKATILSGIVSSCLHWSPPMIPSLFLFSLALSGARAKSNGNLSASVGLNAGLVAGNFIVENGGFVRFNSNAPGWLTGIYAGHPLGGALGLGFVAILALLLYPWNGDPEARKLQTFKKKPVFPDQCLENTG